MPDYLLDEVSRTSPRVRSSTPPISDEGLVVRGIGTFDTSQSDVSTGSSTPTQVAVGTTAVVAVASNGARRTLLVENTGTTVIKLTFGTIAPTQTVYHVSLKGGVAADDGGGEIFDASKWLGQVMAISSAINGTLVFVELTL